mmetsp:Transcript_2327/g.5346  ORF Transcript_2327/g.5346 Transcript_2327/m.5346 type:complete len:208 (-) Transcript_2327:428-1051(-)
MALAKITYSSRSRRPSELMSELWRGTWHSVEISDRSETETTADSEREVPRIILVGSKRSCCCCCCCACLCFCCCAVVGAVVSTSRSRRTVKQPRARALALVVADAADLAVLAPVVPVPAIAFAAGAAAAAAAGAAVTGAIVPLRVSHDTRCDRLPMKVYAAVERLESSRCVYLRDARISEGTARVAESREQMQCAVQPQGLKSWLGC